MVDGGRTAAAAASASRSPSARPADSSARRFGSHRCRSPPTALSASMPASVASPLCAKIRSDTRVTSDWATDAPPGALSGICNWSSSAPSRPAIASRRIAASGKLSPSSRSTRPVNAATCVASVSVCSVSACWLSCSGWRATASSSRPVVSAAIRASISTSRACSASCWLLRDCST